MAGPRGWYDTAENGCWLHPSRPPAGIAYRLCALQKAKQPKQSWQASLLPPAQLNCALLLLFVFFQKFSSADEREASRRLYLQHKVWRRIFGLVLLAHWVGFLVPKHRPLSFRPSRQVVKKHLRFSPNQTTVRPAPQFCQDNCILQSGAGEKLQFLVNCWREGPFPSQTWGPGAGERTSAAKKTRTAKDWIATMSLGSSLQLPFAESDKQRSGAMEANEPVAWVGRLNLNSCVIQPRKYSCTYLGNVPYQRACNPLIALKPVRSTSGIRTRHQNAVALA